MEDAPVGGRGGVGKEQAKGKQEKDEGGGHWV
jgi:hypothetical protein